MSSRRDKYREMADQINAMKPGQAWRIPRFDIADLPGLPDWAFMANITMGFERVKESVIGSYHPHLWRFYEEPNGDITVYRLTPARDDRFELKEKRRIKKEDFRPGDYPLPPARDAASGE